MDENERAGFLIGMAIGFDKDTDEVEGILRQHGLTLNDSLRQCQEAIRAHFGERRWKQGVGLIRQRMNAGMNN